VQLTVTTAQGCTDSLLQTITVHPIPAADFLNIDDTICQNIAASFVNNSTSGMNYLWNFGDGNTSNLFNPTYTYSGPGTYTVQLIVSSPFLCADTISRTVVVLAIPDAHFSASTACFGYQSVFTDSSVGTINGWSWNFGDGSTSILQNPSHLYSSAGSYNTSLTVTNNLMCSDTYQTLVNVNDIPVAAFSIADSCFQDTMQFVNNTIGATTGFQWNFNDGSPLNFSNSPSHIFSSIGSYAIQLIAIGGSGCADTIVKSVSVNPIPTADFHFTSVCQNDTTFFFDASLGSPDTYYWDFGNGQNTTNTPNPSTIYSNDGIFPVSLLVTYLSTGCANSITQNIQAYPRTVPQFSASTPCLMNASQFSDLTTNTPSQWLWDFGDGTTSNLQNPNHQYATSDTFSVQLITQNVFGCADTLLQNVLVHPLPVAGFSFDTVCLNSPTNFMDTSVDAVSWNYDFGDGSTAVNASPAHVFGIPGTFSVSQIVENIYACKDTVLHNVVVRPNPVASFTADTACFSYPTHFINTSSAYVSSAWDFSDLGATSNQNAPNYTFSTDGLFSPRLIVQNVFSCADTVINSVLVLPQPVAGFTSTTVCAKDWVTFSDSSTGSPTTFSWDFGDGSPQLNGNVVGHIYALGGSYNVNYIVQNSAGCADTLVKVIDVYTVPIPNFSADTVCLYSVTHFTDLSTDSVPLTLWTWDLGDGNTSPQQNPNYIYQNSGVYSVKLTVNNQNGCDSSITKSVLVAQVPTADFSYTVNCFGTPTIFTDQSSNNPGIYLWDFGDGTQINGGPNEQHTYASPGMYSVTLSVFGSDSVCGDAITKIVNIAGGAQSDFLIPAQVCQNTPFNFYDNSSASVGTIVSYQWNMGDSTFYTTANGMHAYASPGVYQITLNVLTSSGCQATHTESIEVINATTANFSWSGICEKTATQFNNTSIGGTTNWFWNFGDGTTDQTQFPSHTYTSPGNYSVMLIVQNINGCSDTSVQNLLIHPTPNLAFSSDTVCFGELTHFTNLSTIASDSIDSYYWIFGSNEATSSVINPNYSFTEYTQLHTVNLIAVSNIGCSDTLVQTVDLLPIVNFSVTMSDHFGCAPITVKFDNQSAIQSGAILDYRWIFGDGDTSFLPSPVHAFTQPGNYPISLTVFTSSDCQLELTDSLGLQVFPSPVAGFAVQPPITSISHPSTEIVDDAYGATVWEYDLGDGSYSNSPSFSHTYEQVGTYAISQYVKNDFGCIDSMRLVVEIQDEFTLFVPNTFTPGDGMGINDQFIWSVSGYQTFEIRIFNRWGQLIYTTTDPYAYWDGKYKGELSQDGVYVWQVIALDLRGEKRVVNGHVALLK
jgi:gliding motility-associated-like protein